MTSDEPVAAAPPAAAPAARPGGDHAALPGEGAPPPLPHAPWRWPRTCERFREGKQVAARPVGSAARLARACRRRPLVALLLGLLTASLFGGLAGVTWKWLEANEQRDLANARRQADAEKQAALFQAYRARLSAAVAAPAEPRRGRRRAPARRGPGGPARLGMAAPAQPARRQLAVIPLPAGGADPDPRPGPAPGRSSPTGACAAPGRAGPVERTVPFPHEAERGRTAAQTRRGLRVAGPGRRRTFDAAATRPAGAVCRVHGAGRRHAPSRVVVSPTAHDWRSSGGARRGFSAGGVRRASGKRTAAARTPPRRPLVAGLQPRRHALASAGGDRTARLWDAATGRPLAAHVPSGHTSKVLGVAFRPDGTRLVTTSADGTVRQWDAATGREVEPPYDRHTGEVCGGGVQPGRAVGRLGGHATAPSGCGGRRAGRTWRSCTATRGA